jgi:DNA-binding transcriptional regulator GbsR (MarR family)
MDEADNARDRYATKRLTEMLELIELLTGWFDEMNELDEDTVVALMKLGGGIKKLITTGQRLRGKKPAAGSH